MALERAAVIKLADLARIDLTEAEVDQMEGELSKILDWVSRVKEAIESDTVAMSHPMAVTNVVRADEVQPSMTAEAALAGAPDTEDQQFRVPRILGEQQ